MLGSPQPVRAELWHRLVAASLPLVAKRNFTLDGRMYRYLWDGTGTWRSERAVELPIALAALAGADPARTLEVGNVLWRYADRGHTVVDKYEIAPWVTNEDAETFRGGPYDLILSVSTIEHIGLDEEPREPGKAARAVRNLRSLLSHDGRMLASIPLGYNRDLDDALGDLDCDLSYLVRETPRRWRQAARDEAMGRFYGWPWAGASAVAIARWGSH